MAQWVNCPFHPTRALESKGFVMLSLSATCVSPEVENGRTNGVQRAYRPSSCEGPTVWRLLLAQAPITGFKMKDKLTSATE